jgi:hypothetical protein
MYGISVPSNRHFESTSPHASAVYAYFVRFLKPNTLSINKSG